MDLQNLSRRASSLIQLGTARTHIISSPCTYYHYLCDQNDDRGWGCGYRSLQSLCSWAVLQRQEKLKSGERSFRQGRGRPMELRGDMSSTAREWSVPSVEDIQRALVEVGDKPAEFVGSREWIGCFEACLVLDHLFSDASINEEVTFYLRTSNPLKPGNIDKVACKIIHMSSGTEVVNHVRTLAEHFDSTGSPVMIGGDVDGASKTLIGILLDQSRLSSTRFLVADPHYICTNSEEEAGMELPDGGGGFNEDRVLLRDGGVQWHGIDLFQTASFYNFCLPQTPS